MPTCAPGSRRACRRPVTWEMALTPRHCRLRVGARAFHARNRFSRGERTNGVRRRQVPGKPVARLDQRGLEPDRKAGALDRFRCAAGRRQRRAPRDCGLRPRDSLSHRRRAHTHRNSVGSRRRRSRCCRASRSWPSSTSPSGACRRTAASRSQWKAGQSTFASRSCPASSAKTPCCACSTSVRSPINCKT